MKENVSISLPAFIIEELDRYCDERRLNRSQACETAILRFLGAELADRTPHFFDNILSTVRRDGKRT